MLQEIGVLNAKISADGSRPWTKPYGRWTGSLESPVVQLAEIPWLHDRPVYYWGDLDEAGFEILSRLRNLLPDVRSHFMDEATLRQVAALATAVRPSLVRTDLNLEELERRAYEIVCREGLRFEQEHLPDSLLGRLSLWICLIQSRRFGFAWIKQI